MPAPEIGPRSAPTSARGRASTRRSPTSPAATPIRTNSTTPRLTTRPVRAASKWREIWSEETWSKPSPLQPDLELALVALDLQLELELHLVGDVDGEMHAVPVELQVVVLGERSEERRVGKECRSRWSP